MLAFVALDFETANNDRHSACAVGLVKVVDDQIVSQVHRLINPQTSYFIHTPCHGLTPQDVAQAPLFDAVWTQLTPLLEDVQFIAAHKASFDQTVLELSCQKYQLPLPKQKFLCTLNIARKVWRLKSSSLDCVCDHLGIPLNHHNPLSDALGCAHVLLRAVKEGYTIKI